MSDPHRLEGQVGFPRLAQDPAPEPPPAEGEDWAAMFFHAPIAAFVVDGDGRIVAANVAALALTGVSDLVDRAFASLLGGSTARETVTLVISGEAGSRVAAILATARADLAVELSGTRLPGPGVSATSFKPSPSPSAATPWNGSPHWRIEMSSRGC